MKRLFFIKMHLYFSGVVLVFLLLMSLSGAIHLFAGDESAAITPVKSIQITGPLSRQELTQRFSDELKAIDSSYRFDYIKGSNTFQTTRPTSRTFYTIAAKDDSLTIQKHEPSFRMMLMELHKGHGPRASRNILGLLGLITVGAIITGLWLGWSAPAFRKSTVLSMISGLVIYSLLFFL